MTRPIGYAGCAAVARRLRRKPAWLRELRDFRAHAHMSKTPKVFFYQQPSNARFRVTRATTCICRATTRATSAQPTPPSRNQTMNEKKKGGLRDEMPGAAALVDELRQVFGPAWVDAALREGLRLQREHARRAAEQGQAAADQWLDAQPLKAPAIRVAEAGKVVGALVGNRPARLAARGRA